MILAGFRIRIKDFWLCDLSTRFPKNSFKIVDIHPLKDGAARGILEVSGSADVNQISKFIGEQNEIKTVSTLVDDEDALLLSFYF